MQLATYIHDLLYRYECVIIPGFGAFLTHYHSAHIDAEDQTFYPPGKTLAFNRQLQTNDGLFANYVASVEGCSYETVVLPKIGEFQLNTEGSVQFTPSVSENYSAASFGLSSFISAQISRDVHNKEVDVLLEKAPISFSPEKRTAVPYLKYAAVGLIAIALTGFGGMKWYENEVQKYNFAEKQKANTLVENQIQEATFVITNPLPTLSLTLPKETGKYHVVAGAFRIEENATKKIHQLTDKGYTPRLIGKNRYGLHQVIYSSHEQRLDALRALYTIQQTENKDAWLLVQELD